jgi:hypothetical protein
MSEHKGTYTIGGTTAGTAVYTPCRRVNADIHISFAAVGAERDFDVYMSTPSSNGLRVCIGQLRQPAAGLVPAFLTFRDVCLSPESTLVVEAGRAWGAVDGAWIVLIQERIES